MTQALLSDMATQRARPADGGLALGAAVLLLVPVLAYANAIGIAINVTAATVVVALAVQAWYPIRDGQPIAFSVADAAMAVFVLTSSLHILLSPMRLAGLPTAYVLHSFALTVACPAAYLFGARFIRRATAAQCARIFHLGLALAALFIGSRLVWPDIISTDEIAKGSYYQYAGDCLAGSALVAYARSDRRGQVLALIVVLPVLLLLGSRASLAAYGLALLATRLLPWLLVAGSLLGAVVLSSLDWIGDLMPDFYDVSRTLTSLFLVLIEGNQDSSLSERESFHEQALKIIADHPLWGEYSYDFRINGYEGGFAHSAIDLWAQFGVVTFLAFAAAILVNPLLQRLGQLAVLPNPDKLAPRPLPLLLFLITQFALFRHPESVPLFFCIGCLAHLPSGMPRRSVTEVLAPPGS